MIPNLYWRESEGYAGLHAGALDEVPLATLQDRQGRWDARFWLPGVQPIGVPAGASRAEHKAAVERAAELWFSLALRSR